MSALHHALTEYLRTRRALGTKLGWPESSLRQFVDFIEAEGEGEDFVTIASAMRWAIQPVGVQRATHARRLGIVRGFALWLQATDARTQVPPHGVLPARQRRPLPHIYSEREIADLIGAAGKLHSAVGLRRVTFQTLIGLLVSTGLRPGEALSLDVADVNLVSGIMAVRESKFGKSRFVPLEHSARVALAAYAELRGATRHCYEARAFFVTEHGSRLCACTTRLTFAKLCQTTGLRRKPIVGRCGSGPRLQDFRHTFATRRLVEWYRAGLDVDRLIPRLATYLGHVRVAETYWYIQAVPELLRLATERMERVAQSGVQ